MGNVSERIRVMGELVTINDPENLINEVVDHFMEKRLGMSDYEATRDEILKELSGAGISVGEVAERVKEMQAIMSKQQTITTGKYITEQIAYMNGLDIPLPLSLAVDDLTRSVTAFHERYGTATRENAVENQAKAFSQEAGEFVWKVAAGDLDGAAKEAADVLFTLIGVATLAGITREQLADAMRAIAASNDNKTVEKGWNWNARGTKVEKLTTAEADAGKTA